MGLFDEIKDVFTTDDGERREAAKKEAERAQEQLDEVKKEAGADDQAERDRIAKAEQAAADAREKADDLSAKKGTMPKRDAEPEKQAAPAPKAEPAAPAEPELRTYTVVPGDTLSGIGERFGVAWPDIASLNNIPNPDLIHPGQVFKIPNS